MRPAAAGAVLGLAVAVGAPTAWHLAQPPAAAGAPVIEVLTTDVPRAPQSSATPAPDRLPEITARPATPPPARERSVPVRLALPGSGVDAPVDPVGVQDDGQMAIPENVDRVGWYRFGPRPGDAGSAVLAGHVDDAEQGLGVLASLSSLQPGDEVQVTDSDGTATRWRVVSRELITKRALPLTELFGREGPPRLTLITCGGPFLPEFRSYRDNVVVVAEPLP
jgi:hypothetical protein